MIRRYLKAVMEKIVINTENFTNSNRNYSMNKEVHTNQLSGYRNDLNKILYFIVATHICNIFSYSNR